MYILLLISLLLPLPLPTLALALSPLSTLSFAIHDFTAYTSTPSTSPPSNTTTPSPSFNSISFLARDADMLALCSVYTPDALWGAMVTHPCLMVRGREGDKVWFEVTQGLGDVLVSKRWRWGDMALTGTAAQGTYWNVSAGNMTVGKHGTRYRRDGLWTFEVSRLSGG